MSIEKNTLDETCLLCESPGEHFFEDKFLICHNCGGIFRPRKRHPDREEEKARYELHNSDVNDMGHRNFVSPLVDAVIKYCRPDQSGLDFGAGTAPVVSAILKDKGYNIRQYDPFFHNYPELLAESYDYIVSCEVIEHFHHPLREFKLLKKLLNPGMPLFCMTHIYSSDIPFATWYYKNDPTHVFIYQHDTFEWIRKHLEFASVSIEKRMIRFIKSAQ